MDQVTTYRLLIREMLHEIAMSFLNNCDWEILEAYDDIHGQYLLFTDGWNEEDERDYGCFMHIEVKTDGKIWLRRDGTDLDIGAQLLEKNIPKKHIVLAFQPPSVRVFTDFALA
jgi:XisI protein